MSKSKTYFLDIDGTLIKHIGFFNREMPEQPELLDGVKEKLTEWMQDDSIIVITTARRESLREVTVRQLSKVGIHYDHLIMGCGSGERIIINDTKEGSDEPTAFAYVAKRNTGLKDCPY